VAGKTGTAQRFNVACGGYCGFTASFSGFAPADDPAVVVSVSLQNPVNGHYGGVLAGPVFNEIVSYGLQALEVPPTGAAPPALPLRESDDPVNVD
jgi:cell division protein FtsI (penicillin-binding protein 3)